mmetsp:Transcript_11171/g.24605  ORF Transcript_11171/g.24605 Transcript_11171/m.24605 type:complete len:220 (+) Transcript_11171:1207-1866(+)
MSKWGNGGGTGGNGDTNAWNRLTGLTSSICTSKRTAPAPVAGVFLASSPGSGCASGGRSGTQPRKGLERGTLAKDRSRKPRASSLVAVSSSHTSKCKKESSLLTRKAVVTSQRGSSVAPTVQVLTCTPCPTRRRQYGSELFFETKLKSAASKPFASITRTCKVANSRCSSQDGTGIPHNEAALRGFACFPAFTASRAADAASSGFSAIGGAATQLLQTL